MTSDSNIQLQHCINDLKASMCSLKETLISHSYKAEIIETQIQNFSLQLAELQCKLNSQPSRVLK